MKTLVVLSAFAAVALAAPTLFEEGSEDFNKFIPEIFKRERKSPQESASDSALSAPESQLSTSHISEFGVSGRSFGLKKPIIIKKKPVGYQVYRDSSEVPAESDETCGSQVKVKFCDNKPELKNSAIEDTNTQMTEEDMKHSISLAKEAIENIQRDLNTVEGKPGTQASAWNHGHSKTDAELHQDIEVAREALDHIHKNFGNFESMSLHATTLKEAETVPEVPSTIAKTEEQRLAQWKEAINAIQKNFELVKDIEGSFKMASHGESGLVIPDEVMNNKHEQTKKLDHNLRTSEDVVAHVENKNKSESCKGDHAKEEGHTKGGLIEDDMTSSASTISEKNIKEDQTMPTSEALIETNVDGSIGTDTLLEGATKENDALLAKMALKESPWNSDVSKTMKSVEKDAASAPSETASINAPKSIESEDVSIQIQSKAAVSSESSEKLESSHEMHSNMKSAEHFEEQSKKNKKDKKTHLDFQKEQSKPINTVLFGKSSEEDNIKHHGLITEAQKSDMFTAELNKHLAEGKKAHKEELKTRHEMISTAHDAGHLELQQQQSLFHPEMRTNEPMKNMHQDLMMPPRWAEEKNTPLQRESMTSLDGVHSHTVQHSGHKHHITHGMKNHHFESPNGLGFQSRFPENFLTQEKSADPEVQNYYMSMRDGMGMAPESHRYRWSPSHETARTAYGAPAAPSAGGAVGVFPNANLGGCGIPILLSCNPSVVSGSLAKASPAPSYSGPAYRTEDDFSFHTKRDVKKTHEKLSSSLHRMPKATMKSNTVVVAKQ